MCGIAGLYKLDNDNLPSEALLDVKAMTDKMISRGPDGEGLWQEGSICLGHRRLSIIDLSGGNQPMFSIDGRLCIVFNGEIYNFRTLKKQFIEQGLSFQTDSDTEVILAAYSLYGDNCLQFLEGMFAFVLWDRYKKHLFAARDCFGKKPFYYTIQNNVFAFASELSALATLKNSAKSGQFEFRIDPSSFTRYLAYEYVPTPQTIYKNVNILPPSSYLTIENGCMQINRYWELPVPTEKVDINEACVELRELMTRATSMRMISDVPLGVFLSGGIDSTIVAGLMASQSTEPIKTFSIGFQEASYDETYYSRIAAKAFDSKHYERILSAEECAEVLPRVAASMDTPMADASCAPTWLLSALARENVTVALGGDGADELWAGYEHYIGFRISLLYNSLPLWFRKKIIEPLANLLPSSAGYINPRLAIQTFFNGANSPDWLRIQTMLTAIGPKLQKEIIDANWFKANDVNYDILNEDFLFSSTKIQYEEWQIGQDVSELARAFHVYVRQFLLDDILVKVDRCSMLHSLEVRAPFLDRNTAEFVAKLPLNCKLHGFKRKFLLKKAFADLLPPQILKRNKRGFQIPVAQWLRGKLKPLLLDLLSATYLKNQGIFSVDAVGRMIDMHMSEKADFRKQLWTLLVFQLWQEANRPSF